MKGLTFGQELASSMRSWVIPLRAFSRTWKPASAGSRHRWSWVETQRKYCWLSRQSLLTYPSWIILKPHQRLSFVKLHSACYGRLLIEGFCWVELSIVTSIHAAQHVTLASVRVESRAKGQVSFWGNWLGFLPRKWCQVLPQNRPISGSTTLS